MRDILPFLGLFIGGVFSACGGNDTPELPFSCVTAQEVFGGEFAVDFAFEDGRHRFRVGEPIGMHLSVTNCADAAHSLDYPTAQRYDLVVNSATNPREIWRSSSGEAFAQVQTEETFEAGETKTYTEVWDQKSDTGEPVPVGDCDVEAHALPCESTKIAECESNTVIVIPFEIRPAN